MEKEEKKESPMFVIRLSKENLEDDIKKKIKLRADEEGLTVNSYMNDVLVKLIYG